MREHCSSASHISFEAFKVEQRELIEILRTKEWHTLFFSRKNGKSGRTVTLEWFPRVLTLNMLYDMCFGVRANISQKLILHVHGIKDFFSAGSAITCISHLCSEWIHFSRLSPV